MKINRNMPLGFRSLALPGLLAAWLLGAVQIGESCIPNPPTVSITATDPLASEVGPDTGTFTVTRTGADLTASLQVFYSIGGTASNGADYQTIQGSVVIPSGLNSADITVTPIADSNYDEDTETVVLTLDESSTYWRGYPVSDTVYIESEMDWDGDGLPDSVDDDPWSPDVTSPVFQVLSPAEGSVL